MKIRISAKPKQTEYPLTAAGIAAFGGDVVTDILDRGITGDFVIAHGGREIRIPDTAENYEALERFLKDALENEEV